MNWRAFIFFIFGVICPYFYSFYAFFLYVSLIFNHSNHKIPGGHTTSARRCIFVITSHNVITTSIRRLVLMTCLPHKYDVFSWLCFGHDDTELFTTLYGRHFDVYSDIVFEEIKSFVTFSCCSPQEMTGAV